MDHLLLFLHIIIHKHVTTSAKLNATGLRWVAQLSDYQFVIKYRPGKNGNDADGLSRNPISVKEFEQKCTETCSQENLHALMSSTGEVNPCRISVDNLEWVVGDAGKLISRSELVKNQINDGVIGSVYKAVALGVRPNKEEWRKLMNKSRLLMHQFQKFQIKDGLLMRKTYQYNQIVLPEAYHSLVFSELHGKMGHLAADRLEDLARQRFYWPYMRKEIEDFIKKKCSCVVSKKPNNLERAPLVPIEATYPFEMVSIDFLHLDKCKGGFEHVLVVCDHFTRFSQAYDTKTKSSKAAAEKLFNHFILQFGFPKRIHHDKGPEFNSNLFKHLHHFGQY